MVNSNFLINFKISLVNLNLEKNKSSGKLSKSPVSNKIFEKEHEVMRTYMKIHNIKSSYNKEAIDKLKSRVDSDGEELSVITSGKPNITFRGGRGRTFNRRFCNHQ